MVAKFLQKSQPKTFKADTHSGFCSLSSPANLVRAEHAAGSICTTSTHKGANCGSLLHIRTHMREQTKETCFGIADIHQTRAWKLVQKFEMATYLRSQKKPVLVQTLSSLRLYFHSLYDFYCITLGCLSRQVPCFFDHPLAVSQAQHFLVPF